jgi:NAD(P)-dependent dehydrogenase (short-subunit alcohol dehydrogenase family)
MASTTSGTEIGAPRRVALVTGASRGIGRCAAVALARRGFDVVITARTLREGEGRAHPSSVLSADRVTPIPGSLESTAAEIEALGRAAHVVPMDLMERASVENAATQALERAGRVDVLVNNAIYQGPGTMDRILDLPLDLAERCLIGDYLHPLLLIQLLLPQMLERKEGRVVNMLSEAAFTTPPAPAGRGGWGVAYAAAKAAFHRVTDMCHVEFAGQGILAFSIAPGLTLTESMRASGTDKVLVAAGHAPAPPEVAGEVVGWLGDDAAAAEYAGQMVSSRSLCKKLGLVDGWPPPRPAGNGS